MKAMKNKLAFARALWSFVDLVRHPEHLDRVFQIVDSLSSQRLDILEMMRDAFARDPGGAVALREKPRLDVDLAKLDKLPPGTLGRAFADHMRANGLDPAAIPTLPSDGEIEFVRAHLYETHDV